MDTSLSTLGSESALSPRLAKSVNGGVADSNPELFDFANILGGLVGPFTPPATSTPEISDGGLILEENLTLASSAGNGDTSKTPRLENTIGTAGDLTAGSDTHAQKANRARMAQLSGTAATQLSAAAAHQTASNNLETPTNQQPVAAREDGRLAGAPSLVDDDSTRPALGNPESVTGPSFHSQRLEVQSDRGRNVGVPTLQPSTNFGSVFAPASIGVEKPLTQQPVGPTPTETSFILRPNTVNEAPTFEAAQARTRPSTAPDARGEADREQEQLNNIKAKVGGGEAPGAGSLAEISSSTQASAAFALATPSAPATVTTRARLLVKADERLDINADNPAVAGTREPAQKMGIGELLGVAGRLQFHDERQPYQSSPNTNAPTSTTQGATFQLPPQQQPNLLPQQVISAPVGTPQWPSTFSNAIVRFATEQVTEANLTVTPEDLGTINISIALEGNRVSLGFTAENSEVRAAVNASLPMLHDMLEKSGLSLGQSSVGQEAQRDANPSPSLFAPQNNQAREADALPATPAPAHRPNRPQVGTGRVDFFA